MDLEEEEQLKRRLRVVVSNGLVVSLNPDDPNQMSWSRKVSMPFKDCKQKPSSAMLCCA